ncbi:HsdM family class I SAM-dependent methyltransferase [Dermacoccaceae bacterium W4C1]
MPEFHPGTNEVEWFADLKPLAERIGEQVLGHPVRWNVEASSGDRKRSDVVVTTADGEVLLTGEGKRPDDPRGKHPLVSSEVDDAVSKAQAQGSPLCFTTNFFQIALLSAAPGLHGQPLMRLKGDPIAFIDPYHANQVGWWKALSTTERESLTSAGLRALFERYRLTSRNQAPALSVDDIAVDYFSALTNALLDPLARAFTTVAEKPTPDIAARAMTAGLSLNDPQERRYLVAQGIAEVLTAALFHRLLRNHFSDLEALLGGTQPTTGAVLNQTVRASLADAVQISGDYKPILVIDGMASWVIAASSSDVVYHWIALFDFIDRLDLSAVTTDILGTIFERLISPERRHELGQHYTQPRLARAMAKWGVTSPDIRVLDPACGAGTFLVETYNEHAKHGLTHDQILRRTFGNDIDNFAVHLASINLVTRRIRQGLNHPLIREGDAFQLAPGTTNMLHVAATDDGAIEDVPLPEVDLIIANPPYGRTAPNELACEAHVASRLRSGNPFDHGMNFAAWFVLLGASIANPSARMAFVLPIATLQNDNLKKWRDWLRRRYDWVIWRTEADVWFSDARVATCVILFTPRAAQKSGTYGTVKFVNVLDRVDGELHWIDRVPCPSENVDIADISDTSGTDDLLVRGAMPQPLRLFDEAPSTTRIKKLRGMTPMAGTKLGHKFFELRDEYPASDGALRTVSGLGTTFRINKSHLTPFLTGPKQIDSGEPTLGTHWALTMSETRPGAQTALGRYLTLAESLGVNDEPSVRARRPWWRLTARTFHVAVSMSQQFRHQVAWLNPPQAVKNNFNGLVLDKPTDALVEDAELVSASLASAFGALSMLHQSGEVGNEGARRTLLRHFEEWPVLNPGDVTGEDRSAVLTAYRKYRAFRASEFDHMATAEREALTVLTTAVAKAAHVHAPTRLATHAMDSATTTVAQRRLLEATALKGRTRAGSSGGPSIRKRLRTWTKGYEPYDEALDLLTSGPQVISLRDVSEIDIPTLFADGPFDAVPDTERDLILLVGPRFEAAWPDPENDPERLEELRIILDTMFKDAVRDLLPDDPGADHAGRSTWLDMQSELYIELSRSIQLDVRKELS